MVKKGLRVENISKSFSTIKALQDVCFKVAKGEIIAVLGPSGCGKSTLLSIIGGLEEPDTGDIYWNGESQKGIPTFKRGVGLMFQDYMLFPHKNVWKNVSFGLEMLGWDKEKTKERVEEILVLVGLSQFGSREIHTLSGGEQQRTALARSLAPNPRLLMLDEPISSLDRSLRERLLIDLGIILRSMNQTAIYVTHDQEEAFSIADRVVVLNNGQVVQIGKPEEIYLNPKSEFVAKFLGFKNIISTSISGGSIHTPIGDFPFDELKTTQKFPPDTNIINVLIRPESMDTRLSDQKTHSFSGRIRERTFRGNYCMIELEVKGESLYFEIPTNLMIPDSGKELKLYFNPRESIQVLGK
jgi:ABC-type Fe3+/spermidine/putrescine transport system ATPase subunit